MSPAHLGPYELLDRIGAGGMGEVFLARLRRAQGFDKRLAVKRIQPELASQTRFRELFAAEARLAASLTHPHIVQVTDFADEPQGCYLVMEYVDGDDLASLMANARDGGRGIPVDLCLAVGLAGLRALDYAHARPEPIIHGDVSANNLLLGRQGEVKLADFGLARLGENAPGQLGGNPATLAPEVALGQSPSPASDQFSLAALLYEMCTGEPLREQAPDPESALEGIRRNPPTKASEHAKASHPGLAVVIDRALQADPGNRFSDLKTMEAALEQIAQALDLDTGPRVVERFVLANLAGSRPAGQASPAKTLVADAGPDPAGRRDWRLWIGGIGLALGLIGAGLVSAWFLRSGPVEPENPLVVRKQPAPPGADAGPLPPVGRPDAGLTPGPSADADTDVVARIPRRTPPRTSGPKSDPVPAPPPDGGPAADREAGDPALIFLSSKQCESWSLDGSPDSASPFREGKLGPGAHVLKLSGHAGLKATLRLVVDEKAESVVLAVGSVPFAILRMDGKPKGTTPLAGLRLGPGRHRLRMTVNQPPDSLELSLHIP